MGFSRIMVMTILIIKKIISLNKKNIYILYTYCIHFL